MLPTPQSQQLQPLPGYATSPQPAYGQAAAPTRILHIYHEGLSRRHGKVLDSDKQTVLYRIELKYISKPQAEIFRRIDGAPFATLCFHNFGRGIDMIINGELIKFKKTSLLAIAHEFQSLNAQETLRWKKDGLFSGRNLVCLNSKEQLVAKFEHSFSIKKGGKIELGPDVQGVLLDELVVSGIAMIEYLRRHD